MRKMSIYFQLILFVFIIKSISSNNLIIELLNENKSTKSSINDFINNHKDFLDNKSNDLLNLFNNNFNIEYLPNKKKVNNNINGNGIAKFNRHLTKEFGLNITITEIKGLLNFIKSGFLEKNRTKLIDLIYNNNSIISPQLNKNNILPFLEEYKKYIIKICTDKSNNTIDFINLLVQNDNHIMFIVEIIKNYFNYTLKNYISNSSKKRLENCQPQFINNLINILYNYIQELNLREDFINFLFDREIKRMKIEEQLSNYKISDNCIMLLNYTLLGINIGEQKDDKTIKFYRRKFLEGNKEKNDFSKYERCLENDGDRNNSYLNNTPVVVVSIVDGTYQDKNIKKNTFFEKYYFVVTNCFPQGNYYNKTTNQINDLCSKEDYNSLVNLTFGSLVYSKLLGINSTNLGINSFIIMENGKPEFSSYEITVSIEEEEDEDEEKIKEELKKVVFPKRIILLNYFFNLRENIKELFNFKSNLTNINNMNGLNYIKGLIGISMILIVFGHTYFILFNLPLKKYGQWNFYNIIHSIIYVIPMSGLRYSPRIILSCSGFTFTYKYLSYLDKKSNNYFLKFLFQQSHKYFILIMIFLGKPLPYILHYIFIGNIPIRELENYFLKKPEKLEDFLLNFISFKLNDNFNIEKSNRNSQDLFDYFWLPFNEVLFFIIGLILISVGYKFKFRIDLIIIISFFVFYLLKIILYYNYFNKKEGGIYSTLYYYIIDFGKLMLLPNFNFSYYLIGMFFGFMHYTVQKVMPEIEQNKYEIMNLNEENILLKDEEEKMVPKIDKSFSINRASYNIDLFSYDNKEEKEGFASGKNLKVKLLDSNSIKIRRNITGKLSNNLLKKVKTNDLLVNNNSNKIEDDNNSIKKKDSLNDLE